MTVTEGQQPDSVNSVQPPQRTEIPAANRSFSVQPSDDQILLAESKGPSYITTGLLTLRNWGKQCALFGAINLVVICYPVIGK
jgi:hypothetical protein